VRAALLPHRALLLAGGLGTRLRSVLADRPKVLAPVLDRTFLDCLVEQLHREGLRRLVFLLGYRHEMVAAHIAGELAARFQDMEAAVTVEEAPLGTGGALGLARDFCHETFLLVNGDTYLEFNARDLVEAHRRSGAMVTIAARLVEDARRYGSLEVDGAGRVRAFREKAVTRQAGLINAGVYVMEPRVLELIPAGVAVSLEQVVLPELLARGERLAAVEVPGRFFDIGTPESYAEFARFAGRPGARDPAGGAHSGGMR
jgi:NDP-sugar pyrophosphorylase family protein